MTIITDIVTATLTFLAYRHSHCSDYGVVEEDPNLIPRGPKFSKQPGNILLVPGIASVVVDCAVYSIPTSQYRMYRTLTTTGQTTLITPDLDPR